MGREKGRTKSLLTKTLERCYSLVKSPKHETNQNPKTLKSGYFSVYVGPQKERFVIRTAHLNHPLFRSLLDEAELVYGYDAKGPLVLPSDVESFLDTVWEIEKTEVERSPICGLRTSSKYELLSPSKVGMNRSFSFPFSPLRR